LPVRPARLLAISARPSPSLLVADPDPCDFTYIPARGEYACSFCPYFICAREAECVAAAKALWVACHAAGIVACTGGPGCPGHL
jgi:hypothetical protein